MNTTLPEMITADLITALSCPSPGSEHQRFKVSVIGQMIASLFEATGNDNQLLDKVVSELHWIMANEPIRKTRRTYTPDEFFTTRTTKPVGSLSAKDARMTTTLP